MKSGAAEELHRGGSFLCDLYVGHSLTGGAADLQDAVAQDENVVGIVLLSGFLRRIWREGVSTCEGTWASQPTHECPSGVGLP